jgi:hypothetical protein
VSQPPDQLTYHRHCLDAGWLKEPSCDRLATPMRREAALPAARRHE